MSAVRPLEGDDIAQVAAMFQRVLRKERSSPPASLLDYMKRFYLDAPGRGDGVNPLVHVADAGHVSGFVGVHALPMRFNGRPLRAAICGSLMVEDHERDPMAGARLLKAFLDGPQDLSFSETANEVSTQLWTRLRGVVLPQYSLDWVRVIRPSAFGLGLVANRITPARAFGPLAHLVDGYLRKRLAGKERRWSGVPAVATAPSKLRVEEVGAYAFAGLLESLSAQFVLRPRWGEMPLARILADAAEKPELGELVLARVASSAGVAIGAFAYHARPAQIGRVLQVLGLPGQAGAVIDCLIDHAAARGATGLRGRTQPALLEAMLVRRIAFVPVASTVAHSRNAGLLDAMTGGRAFLNGLAGEQWSRLIGGSFI